MSRPFLTAAWHNLVMLNFAVEPRLLEPLVPAGTVLDSWHGTALISLVGFLFADTRVLGVPIPAHRTFEEVNLRFYVERTVGGERRRGVTFVRELVPRRAIAITARFAYNEPYVAVPMRHEVGPVRPDGVPDRLTYAWRHNGAWTELACAITSGPRLAAPESQEAFITEHYCGYTRQRDGGTVEYRVEHAPWRVWDVAASLLGGDLISVYGRAFAEVLSERPASAFLADGSRVAVYGAQRLPTDRKELGGGPLDNER